MKILIFLHGTSIMHKSGKGKTRNERVMQVKRKDKSVYEYKDYIPVGKVVNKLKSWEKQGATIEYLSSHRIKPNIEKDKLVLEKYSFPKREVHFRHKGEKYHEVAERLIPDILIEDDCESIGGEKEMTYTFINPELKKKIISISIKEFGGIDHLSDNLEDLKNYS